MHFKTKLLLFTGSIVFITIFACLLVVRYFAVDNFIDYLNREEISRTINPPPKIDINIIAKELGKNPKELVKSLQNAKEKGLSMREFLRKEGINPLEMMKILPQSKHGNDTISWRQKLLTEPLFEVGSPEKYFISQIFNSLLITGIIILVLMLIVAFFFSSFLSRPIFHITEAIRSIKDKNQPLKVPVESEDEIGMLARTVNKLSSKLSKQEKIRNHFLADISHEIKTPLTALKCYIEGIKDGVFQPNTKLFEKIIKELDRVSHIVNELMEQARFASEAIKLKKETCHILDLIENVDSNNNALLSKKRQSTNISIQRKMKPVVCDNKKMIQVIQNIYSNFHKYTIAGKHLQIDIKQNKHETILSFKDNGKGVNNHDLQFIFEKFYQAEKSRTGKASERGLGVGLSIVKQIIDAHGGETHLKSEKGKFFEIIITLPNVS